MQTQRIENIDVRDNVIQPLVLVEAEKAALVSIGGSPKAAFRKFAAENQLHIQPIDTATLKQQYEAGILQAQINAKRIDPNTLIHRAIVEKSPEVLAFLLSHRVDVDYPDANGMSPLTIAILSQQPEIVKLLLDNGANVSPEKKWNGMSLLEISITAGDVESAKYLMENGADLNTPFKNGDNAVQYYLNAYYRAMLYEVTGEQDGKIEKYKFFITSLIESDKLSSSSKDQAFTTACLWWQQALYRDLAEPLADSLLMQLIQKGANVNDGISLAVACQDCRNKAPELIKLLLDHGADPNASPRTNRLPPMFSSADNLSVLKMLIEFGADPNKLLEEFKLCWNGGEVRCNSVLVTAIHTGADSSALDRVKLLVEAGADIYQKVDGKMPIAHALEKGRMDVVNYLLLKDENA